MVAPTPKSPRYQLAAHERQLYREALQKKATRKKAANLTTPAIEIPRSKKKTSPAGACGWRGNRGGQGDDASSDDCGG
ncbi:hypothetical protein PC128_g9651 [Phytophthora cactorum]|nr:hypothetical protein PC120_g16737 [Phytophthora cactorum]KAG3061777.1 hypothetical protein PC121_g12849 [Phytophthora cactorum]KAG3194112.1 hypothetical protein PC128_g9651 [Phytophthora cactorum]